MFNIMCLSILNIKLLKQERQFLRSLLPLGDGQFTNKLFNRKEFKSMVDKKGILELRKRFKKESCTVTTLAGCYVDGSKKKVTTFRKNLLNLDDAEFFKYLKILKKSVSGQVRKNLLGLEFDKGATEAGGMQQFLLGLTESQLKNDDMLDILYDKIIYEYDYPGNFIILLFYDTYDVIKRSKDNSVQDESEEAYSYFICSICPVSLSKPGLGYNAPREEFEPVEQDWMINDPDIAFLYPSFSDRSADVNTLTYYVKKPLETHPEIAEVLGCNMQKTSVEERECLKDIIYQDVTSTVEYADEVVLKVQQNFMDKDNMKDDEGIFDDSVVVEVLEEHNIPESELNRLKADLSEQLSKEIPLSDLYDEKEISKEKQQQREKELLQEITELKGSINDAHQNYEELITKLEKKYPSGSTVSIDEIIATIRS